MQFQCLRFSSSRRLRTSLRATETVAHSAAVHGGGGDEGKFAAILQHFSASVHLDVEAQGGGDAASLTPGRSATPSRCMR